MRKEDLNDFSNSLIGKWEWIESSGGITGVILTPGSEGVQVTIEFNGNTYRKYVDGNLETEKTYKIEKGSSIFKTENVDLIIYEDNWKQSFQLHGDTLFLYDECYDCFLNEYHKDKGYE